jgi:hypothetical protein
VIHVATARLVPDSAKAIPAKATPVPAASNNSDCGRLLVAGVTTTWSVLTGSPPWQVVEHGRAQATFQLRSPRLATMSRVPPSAST